MAAAEAHLPLRVATKAASHLRWWPPRSLSGSGSGGDHGSGGGGGGGGGGTLPPPGCSVRGIPLPSFVITKAAPTPPLVGGNGGGGTPPLPRRGGDNPSIPSWQRRRRRQRAWRRRHPRDGHYPPTPPLHLRLIRRAPRVAEGSPFRTTSTTRPSWPASPYASLPSPHRERPPGPPPPPGGGGIGRGSGVGVSDGGSSSPLATTPRPHHPPEKEYKRIDRSVNARRRPRRTPPSRPLPGRHTPTPPPTQSPPSSTTPHHPTLEEASDPPATRRRWARAPKVAAAYPPPAKAKGGNTLGHPGRRPPRPPH